MSEIKVRVRSSRKEITFTQDEWNSLTDDFKKRYQVLTIPEPVIESKPKAKDKRKPPRSPQADKPKVEKKEAESTPSEAGADEKQKNEKQD